MITMMNDSKNKCEFAGKTNTTTYDVAITDCEWFKKNPASDGFCGTMICRADKCPKKSAR
jgi:hypothetical protein